jgi:branched-chain amino acid transport system substrate-binding protein
MVTERGGATAGWKMRRGLRWTAAVALVASATGLAACGGDDNGGGSAEKQQTLSSASGKELVKLLGYSQDDLNKLKGKTIKLGTILALSGPESSHGTSMRRGLELAKNDIKAAGGPTLDISYEDQKSGDPQAAAAAARKLGEEGHGITLASYEFNFGAELPAFKRYKMLALDPGGGTGGLFNGQPYAWGFRGIEPDDALQGAWKFVKGRDPQVKRVANIVWDLGDAFTKHADTVLGNALKANGLQLAGTVRSKIGTTDYSDAISKIRGMNADGVHLFMAGLDLAYFTKQWKQAGLKQPLVGNEYLPEMAPIAGSSFDNWLFAVDYWEPASAPNPLSKLFQKHFKEAYGKDASSFYEANFYEAGLAVWDLALRVAKKGGDISSGDDLQNALLENPSFKSVYGGDDSTVGTIALDKKTHSVSVRPNGVWQLQGSGASRKPVQVASFNSGGVEGYKETNSFEE